MQGIVQRPAARGADVKQHGDHVEVRWRIRPGSGQASRTGKRYRDAGKRGVVEALLVTGALAVVVALLYVHARPGAVGV